MSMATSSGRSLRRRVSPVGATPPRAHAMDGHPSKSSDARLRKFLAASNADWQGLLDELISSHLRTIVRAVIRSRLKNAGLAADDRGEEIRPDLEDLEQQAILRIVQRLLGYRQGEAEIKNCESYAAMVAEHACDEFYRRRFRVRYNISKRVAVHLQNHELFAEYKPEGRERLGCLRAWRVPPPEPVDERYALILNDGRSAVSEMFAMYPSVDREHPSTVRCMWTGLTWCCGALPIDPLVSIVQAARNEYDSPTVPVPDDLAAPKPPEETDVRTLLDRLWQEIAKLPRRQASALLLNLRIGDDSGLELFPILEIATTETLAGVLGFEVEEMKRVVDSPRWSDKQVAARLGCTESQVTGLRSVARRTLKTRLPDINLEFCE